MTNHPGRRTARVRSNTFGLNVVHWDDGNSTINTFINGHPEDSFEVEGHLTAADALIWLGTKWRLERHESDH